MSIETDNKINEDRYYKPTEIVKNGWIQFNGNWTYNFILKLINKNRLKAKNFGMGKTPHYRVKGSDLIQYKNDWE
jgi:hypothetical protein